MPLNEAECKILTNEILHIKESIDDIKIKLDTQFVTKAEFWPVARIAYGVVGVMGLTLLAAMVRMVLK
jgi:hypothetical protein